MRLNINSLPLIVKRTILFLTVVSITLFSIMLFSGTLYSQEPQRTDSIKQLPVKKYFHDVQLGMTVAFLEIGAIPLMELSTSHRINISKRFSAGIGISTIYFVTLTPYMVGRLNFREQGRLKRSVPFISLKAGCMLFLKSSSDKFATYYFEPEVGYSFFGKTGKTSWTIFLAGNCFELGFFPKIGVGFEF